MQVGAREILFVCKEKILQSKGKQTLEQGSGDGDTKNLTRQVLKQPDVNLKLVLFWIKDL